MPSQTSSTRSLQHAWFVLKTLNLPLLLRSVRYSLEKAYAELKYAEPIKLRGGLKLWLQAIKQSNQPRPAPPPFDAFNKPGAVLSWKHNKNQLTLTCQNASIQLTAFAERIIQVRLYQDALDTSPSYAVHKPVEEWHPPKTTVTENGHLIIFKTSALTVQVNQQNSYIDFLDQSGQAINLDSGGLGWTGQWAATERNLPAYAPIFGLGEQASLLNLRGRNYKIWAKDPSGVYGLGDNPLYQAHPWFLCLNQQRAFGLFLDNTAYSLFDLGHSQPNSYTLTSSKGEFRYYFIYGPDVKTILSQFTELTGRMAMPPLWALGLHQSRWSYKSAKEVKAIARQFRERHIPCDVIHLDIHYMKNYQVFTWNKRRFPNPGEMVKDLRENGFRLISIIDPGIKADRLNPLAEEGLKQDVFLKYPDGKVFKGPVWPGDCYFPDFTDPRTRIWWGELYRPLIEDGIAGFWNDMNEPALFGYNDGTIPNTVQHNYEGHQADHATVHNVYGMQMARATRHALTALRPNRRPFVLSRAGFTGIQRYAAVWTGDNESSWEHLQLSLSMTLNLGLSGLSFAGPDVGGFQGTPDPELFARWIQLGAFLPFFRIHTANHTPAQEPWAFGPKVEAIAKKFIQLRYQLLPYLYTAFWQAAQSGLPVARPVWLNFQDDLKTHSLEDQFMLGDALLLAPILTPNTPKRKIYLPMGPNWYNYWTGECLAGGQNISVQTPLDHLPLFVRGGSVIAHWPHIQHTDQAKTLGAIALHLFAGSGSSVLYEDSGEGTDYQQEGFRRTLFACQSNENHLVLTARFNRAFAPSYQIINWTVYTPQPIIPSAITADGVPIDEWSAGSAPNTITFRTSLTQRLEIRY